MTEGSSRPSVRHVLVADDEPYLGRIVQLKLEQGPYKVSLVGDGREAMERIEGSDPIDLILLDIMMPEMTGLEVLSRTRRLEHRRKVPIIILTAKGQESDRARALSLGATDFFTKPFSPKKLAARVNELFQQTGDRA